MNLPSGQAPFDCVEVRFKNGRKEFYRNTEHLTLSIGDIVATEGSSGHDIGIVTLTGELVRVQMKKKSVKIDSPEVCKIYRKASQKDIDIWSAARDREEPMKIRARELAIALQLEMKISDIEFQGDASKATFYYTANDRVDFRQLIKEFAREFIIRIEMKQVGFRQEAARLGGIGSCGRELCCSTWLTDFRSVNTSAARYQQLSLNPQKLAGQCGKLKCCLNYELDTYMDALREFPEFDVKLSTEKGDAICQKQDIFKGLMWFAYTDNFANWHTIKTEQVKEIIAENKLGNKVASLEDFEVEAAPTEEKVFSNAVGQESLTRFDQPKRKKRNKGNGRDGVTSETNSSHKKPNPTNRERNENRNSRGPKPETARDQNATPLGETSSSDRTKPQDRKSPQRRPERSGQRPVSASKPEESAGTEGTVSVPSQNPNQKPKPNQNRNKNNRNNRNRNKPEGGNSTTDNSNKTEKPGNSDEPKS